MKLFCYINIRKGCCAYSPYRFHHSCRDWRHSHRCLSGNWLQSIQIYTHSQSLQPDPAKKEHVEQHGKFHRIASLQVRLVVQNYSECLFCCRHHSCGMNKTRFFYYMHHTNWLSVVWGSLII